jgi:hypothetical protein
MEFNTSVCVGQFKKRKGKQTCLLPSAKSLGKPNYFFFLADFLPAFLADFLAAFLAVVFAIALSV